MGMGIPLAESLLGWIHLLCEPLGMDAPLAGSLTGVDTRLVGSL